MEDQANNCHTDHSKSNACLPPRKRLFARLMKQNCENASSHSSFSSDFGVHLRELLGIDPKQPHVSLEKIVEASKSAALAAAEVAAKAKATAIEKAEAAAKATIIAKSALEFVASVKKRSASVETCQQRSKVRKEVPFKLLYKGHQLTENHESDEELARRLHRAMNSSPRILKNPVNSSVKINEPKTHMQLPALGEVISLPSICGRDVEVDECVGDVLEGGSPSKLDEGVKICIAEANHAVEILHEEDGGRKFPHSVGEKGVIDGKRARIKQKMLPLSLCNTENCEKPKEKTESKDFSSNEGKCTARTMPSSTKHPSNKSDFSVESIAVWNCQDLAATKNFAESKMLQHLCSKPTVTKVSSTMIKVDQ